MFEEACVDGARFLRQGFIPCLLETRVFDLACLEAICQRTLLDYAAEIHRVDLTQRRLALLFLSCYKLAGTRHTHAFDAFRARRTHCRDTLSSSFILLLINC